MARRDGVKEALDQLRPLRGQVEGGEDLLRKHLAHRSGHVVGAAADIIREREDIGFESELRAAFRRLNAKGAKLDPGCTGQLACVQALDVLGCADESLFMKAVSTIQREPAWGGAQDTAAGLRSQAVWSLTRLGPSDLLILLSQALLDESERVQEEAARCIGIYGHPHGLALLHLALGHPKRPPRGLSPGLAFSALRSMLALDAAVGLDWARQALQIEHPLLPELLLAIGESREEEGLSLLQHALAHHHAPAALTAAGLLRSEAARDWLLHLLASEDRPVAKPALEALKVYAFQGDTLANARRAAARNPYWEADVDGVLG